MSLCLRIKDILLFCLHPFSFRFFTVFLEKRPPQLSQVIVKKVTMTLPTLHLKKRIAVIVFVSFIGT